MELATPQGNIDISHARPQLPIPKRADRSVQWTKSAQALRCGAVGERFSWNERYPLSIARREQLVCDALRWRRSIR